ncbi:Hypothetical predicted protein, partial [Paramuricea clavata]
MREASRIVALSGYPNYPTFRHVVENFTTPSSARAYYGQRLRSWFHAPESGNYKFTINCPYACDFYFTYKHELTKKLFYISTGPVAKTTEELTLVAGELYTLDVVMVFKNPSPEFSLGFQHIGSGLIQNPIGREYLMWKPKPLQGVARSVWNTRFYSMSSRYDVRWFIERFPLPDHQDVLTKFEVPEYGRYYAQRLEAYLLAPTSGSYNFYMACSEGCYFYQGDVYRFSSSGVSATSKYTGGTSYSLSMEGGLFYHLKVLHYVTTTTNYITFGVTLPDGTQLRPIPGKYLWIELPEKVQYEDGAAKQARPVNSHFAINAVDNNPSTCSLSKQSKDPWLRLYTEYIVNVHAVAITNRVEHSSSLDNFKIKVGDNNPAKKDDNLTCYGPVSHIPAGKTVAFPCKRPLTGKYVVVYIYGNSRTLSICELVIYGERVV